MRASKRWVGLGALALVACGLPEVDLEGAHVRLAIAGDLTPCGDAIGHMDRFVELVAAELGVQPPTGDDRITYYWLQPGDLETRDICPDRAAACAPGGKTIYAESFPLDHELVHSLAHEYGNIPSFFAEGLAEAHELPPPGPWDAYGPNDVAIEDAIESIEDRHILGDNYSLAGGFVAFLIDRNGLPALRRALARMRSSDGTRRISSILAAELGASLATLTDEFDRTRRDCPPGGFRRKLFECSAPELAWNGAVIATHRTLDCSDDDVIGPFADDTLAHYRTLTVPADASYDISVIGDADSLAGERPNAVTLLRCGGCDEDLQVTATAGAAPTTVMLPAGRYSLRFTGPVASATGVGLRLARVEAP